MGNSGNFEVVIAYYPSLTYNLLMDTILILQVIVETSSYLKAVESFWDTDTQVQFKNFIASNFLAGDVIPNTGGLHKIRWQGKGH